ELRMAFDFGDELSGGGVPDPGRAVPACGDDEFAVRTVGRAPDGTRMAFEFGDELSGRGDPDPSRAVLACGDDELSVWAVGRASDGTRMASKDGAHWRFEHELPERILGLRRVRSSSCLVDQAQA